MVKIVDMKYKKLNFYKVRNEFLKMDEEGHYDLDGVSYDGFLFTVTGSNSCLGLSELSPKEWILEARWNPVDHDRRLNLDYCKY